MGRTHLDQVRRSKQNWERGRGARRKGNPRYKPVYRKGRKVYILRKKWLLHSSFKDGKEIKDEEKKTKK